MPIFGNVFLSIGAAYGKEVIAAQLQVIKANNSREFYMELLRTGEHFLGLLQEASHNKVVNVVAEMLREPIENAAELDDITL